MSRTRALRAGLLVAAFVVPAMDPASAGGFSCLDFLRMHGLLRKAQGACGFAAYNPVIVDQARACFDAVGNRRGSGEMLAGAAEFDRLGTIRSREAICTSLAAKFPMVIDP
jgi:hypothetical protein